MKDDEVGNKTRLDHEKRKEKERKTAKKGKILADGNAL